MSQIARKDVRLPSRGKKIIKVWLLKVAVKAAGAVAVAGAAAAAVAAAAAAAATRL